VVFHVFVETPRIGRSNPEVSELLGLEDLLHPIAVTLRPDREGPHTFRVLKQHRIDRLGSVTGPHIGHGPRIRIVAVLE